MTSAASLTSMNFPVCSLCLLAVWRHCFCPLCCSLCLLQGFDITPDLRRMCPSLTLQQIYKLSEHHHDDWITAVGDNQGTKTIVLLETLKRAVDSSGGMATPPRASPMMSADGVPQTPSSPGGGPNPYPSPGSISSAHQFEDEDNLLLDSQVVPPYLAVTVL